jgi:hypothetical protein
MAAKSILVVSSLIALAFAAPQAFAGNAPNMAAAPTQQISPPTDGSSPDAQNAQPGKKHRHHRKNARKQRQQQQQPGGAPQQGWGQNPG